MDQEQLAYPDLLVPRDYLIRAHDFYSACRILPDFHPGFMPLWPQLALFGLAIELVLKAYLLSKGESREELKHKYGHKLQKLYLRSIDLGLQNDERIGKMIGFINEPYSIHVPRYPDPETMGRAVATVPQFFEDYDSLMKAVNEAISRIA
ncbi:hypothetical protein [Rhizobium sp. NPDC090279]|uniref:hypothetical protein n=1 Tax=Rhizobium sp. NPDC090279 TaxID=3364499 RepID=UPI00383BDEA4